MRMNSALAVVYPASEYGDTAAGLDGFRGSAARQMDELMKCISRDLI